MRVMGSNQLYLCATPEGERASPSHTLLAHCDAFLRPETFASSQEMQNVSSSLLTDTSFFLRYGSEKTVFPIQMKRSYLSLCFQSV